MRVIAVSNQKGGCGKTTTSINLASCLAILEKKVLIIDMDPQGHSTCGLGVHAESLPYSLYDLFKDQPDRKPFFSQVLIDINPYLSILPTYVLLSVAEESLSTAQDPEKRLRKILDGAMMEGYSYDYVILDCPPNLGYLTFNALDVADDVVIPIEPSVFSLHGLKKVTETLDFVNKKRAIPMDIHALLTIYDAPAKFSQEIYEELRESFGNRLFKNKIRENVLFKEAAREGKSIDRYARNSPAFQDYYNLALEYLERDMDRKLGMSAPSGWDEITESRLKPREVLGGTLFQTIHETAQYVEIAGDFNQWVPEPMMARYDQHLWQIVLPVGKGRHRYKFIVDGEWQLDVSQTEKVVNQYGGYDSCLEVV